MLTSGITKYQMSRPGRKKTTFMTERVNYQYNVMPFGLKNASVTYQRMMNKIFQEEIGDTLELYMYDMIVKSNQE